MAPERSDSRGSKSPFPSKYSVWCYFSFSDLKGFSNKVWKPYGVSDEGSKPAKSPGRKASYQKHDQNCRLASRTHRKLEKNNQMVSCHRLCKQVWGPYLLEQRGGRASKTPLESLSAERPNKICYSPKRTLRGLKGTPSPEAWPQHTLQRYIF